jgi:hypothetical protein
MRAAIFEAGPMRIKAVFLSDQVVNGVGSDETVSGNAMITGTELLAFGFCEQVRGKTGADSIEDPLILGRESVHYGRHSHLAKNNLTYRRREEKP